MIRPHDSQSGAERQAENWLAVSRVGAMLVVPSIVIILGAFCAIKIIALVAARVIAAKETRLALAEVSVDHISPGLADLIAYLGSDGNIYTIAPDGSGRKQVTLDASDDPTDRVIYQGLAWSPNGKYLAYIRISPGPTTNPLVYLPDAFIYLPESDEQCQIDLQGQFSRLVWTADSSALLYDREVHWNNSGKPVDPIYGVWKYDLVGGQSSEVVPPAHQDPLVARSVSPEGRYISFNEIRYVDGPGFFGVFDL
ncbi:MAG TPA: hypothetical protein VHO48_03585 [Anaerolineaceae bacterium]|nr:hypothetical protein [Anaerolineaceae bacterium]